MSSERRRAALMLAGIGLTLSLLCGWLLADSITASLAAWQGRAAEVRVSGGDIGMLVLMPIFLALTVWGTVAAFRDDGATRRIGNGIAVAAAIALFAALAGAWALQAWAENRLAEEGYVRCGTDRTGRFASLTFCARKADPV